MLLHEALTRIERDMSLDIFYHLSITYGRESGAVSIVTVL